MRVAEALYEVNEVSLNLGGPTKEDAQDPTKQAGVHWDITSAANISDHFGVDDEELSTTLIYFSENFGLAALEAAGRDLELYTVLMCKFAFCAGIAFARGKAAEMEDLINQEMEAKADEDEEPEEWPGWGEDN